MAQTKIVNDIKRRVTGGRSSAELEREPARLVLAEYDGILWASNRYWLTSAPRVAPLLEQYNLSATEPGDYLVNGTVRRSPDGRGFDPGSLIGKLENYPAPIAPVKLAGRDAHVPMQDGSMLAVYQTADGTMMGLVPETLAWLSRLHELPVAERHYYEGLRIMSKGHGGEVLLVADLIHTIKPHSYGTDPDTREQTSIPAVTENLGPRVIGVMMAIRLDS